MDTSVRDFSNMLGRTILAEQLACLIVISRNQGKFSLPETQDKLGKLRTLVGPTNTEEFLSISKAFWNDLKAGDVSPYLRAKYRSARKTIKEILKREDFDELWVANQLFNAEEEHWISDAELWGWISQFEGDEEFTNLVLRKVFARGVTKTVEDFGRGIDETELIRRISELDLTMRDLALLRLILELDGEMKVVPIVVPENPEFQLPTGGNS